MFCWRIQTYKEFRDWKWACHIQVFNILYVLLHSYVPCVLLFVFCHYVFYVFPSLCASTASVTHRQTRQQVAYDVIWSTYKCAVYLLGLPEEEAILGSRRQMTRNCQMEPWQVTDTLLWASKSVGGSMKKKMKFLFHCISLREWRFDDFYIKRKFHLIDKSTVYLYEFKNLGADDVVVKVQTPSARVWDPPVQFLRSSPSHLQSETNYTNCPGVDLGKWQLLGQEGGVSWRWRISAGDKETQKTLL